MTLLSCWMAAAVTVVGWQPPVATTRVAVVNVGAASERYLRTSALEETFDKERIRLNAHRDELRGKIDRLKRSLEEEFKPGTKEHNERRKQLAMLRAELQWFMDSEGQRIEQGLASSLRSIFDDIREVVRKVAEEKQIDVVLAVDRLPANPPDNPNQARQQILLQKVIYWNPTVDLTDEVVRRLNAEFNSQGSSHPAALPPTPDDEKKSGKP